MKSKLADWTTARLAARWQGPPIAVRVGGRRFVLGTGTPATEVVVHEPRVLWEVLLEPSLGFGEAYTRGALEVRGDLAGVLAGAYRTWPESAPGAPSRLAERARAFYARGARRRAVAEARHHYDLGNDFYDLWLDRTRTYSCAFFLRETDDLETAQRQKLELLCRKARLAPGQTLLDVGCGWGSLLFHAARHHGVHATGVTPSEEQARAIEADAERAGLSDRVRVHRGDWRDLEGTYDRLISVGMFEHVGREHYPDFMRKWRARLAEGGLSVLHTIGRMRPQPPDPWIRRHIFPGGYLPSLDQIVARAADASMWIADVENLRPHYARTLACWAANFAEVWDEVSAARGEDFARMWWLYLKAAEAAFRWGGLHLWQVVLARDDEAPWPLDREVRPAEARPFDTREAREAPRAAPLAGGRSGSST
jgi:cyclopropane-fatty-acyl-phospholipid synthase